LTDAALWGLHDAKLRDIRIDWQAATLTASVMTQAGAGEVAAEGLVALRCPRHQPWGPSSSINAVASRSEAGRLVHIRVEMQSGDLIEIDAESISYRST
jgi:hypothetical protein